MTEIALESLEAQSGIRVKSFMFQVWWSLKDWSLLWFLVLNFLEHYGHFMEHHRNFMEHNWNFMDHDGNFLNDWTPLRLLGVCSVSIHSCWMSSNGFLRVFSQVTWKFLNLCFEQFYDYFVFSIFPGTCKFSIKLILFRNIIISIYL